MRTPQKLSTTASKKLRKLARAQKRSRFLAQVEPTPTTASTARVRPGLTSAPIASIGDRVLIKHGRLTARENVLFGGATGRILHLERSHTQTVATVALDKRNAAGHRLKVRKPMCELYILAAGEWRQPRSFDARPEHQTVYGSVFG